MTVRASYQHAKIRVDCDSGSVGWDAVPAGCSGPNASIGRPEARVRANELPFFVDEKSVLADGDPAPNGRDTPACAIGPPIASVPTSASSTDRRYDTLTSPSRLSHPAVDIHFPSEAGQITAAP